MLCVLQDDRVINREYGDYLYISKTEIQAKGSCIPSKNQNSTIT